MSFLYREDSSKGSTSSALSCYCWCLLWSTLVTDTLSTMLRLLGEESEEASWLIQAQSRIEPVELCDEEW